MSKYIVYCDGGATAHEEHIYYGGFGIYIENADTGEKTTIYGPMKFGDTNNRAEMWAFIRAMQWLIDNKAKFVEFHLDSQYVIKGTQIYMHNWKKNNWTKKDGIPIKNLDFWKLIYEKVNELAQQKIQYTIDWVKGHTGVEGNEIADEGATRGTAMCLAGETEEVIRPLTEDFKPVEDKKNKKVKVEEPHAYLCGRRLLDMVNGDAWEEGENRFFMTCSYDDTDAIKSRGLGIAAGDQFEGLVMTKRKMPIYDLLLARQSEISPPVQRPVIFFWDKISSAKFWKELNIDGGSVIRNVKENLTTWDLKTQLSHYLNPPRQAKLCVESMQEKAILMRSVLTGEINSSMIHDLTDLFYVTNDKGKQEASKDLIGLRSIEKVVTHNGRDIKLIMAMDYEIPGRNTFARLAKQDKEVKVELIIHDTTPNTFRWSLLVTSPMGAGLYNNPSTNLTIVP